jgi:hypothetical protein
MFNRSRHLHDGVLVDGVRVSTVVCHEDVVPFVLKNLALIFVHGWVYPRVDIVIRNDGQEEILYSEGSYKSSDIQPRIDEVVDRIREVGIDQFLSEVGEPPVAGRASVEDV